MRSRLLKCLRVEDHALCLQDGIVRLKAWEDLDPARLSTIAFSLSALHGVAQQSVLADIQGYFSLSKLAERHGLILFSSTLHFDSDSDSWCSREH